MANKSLHVRISATMTLRKIGLSSLSLIQIKLDYTLNDLLPNLDASYDAARLYMSRSWSIADSMSRWISGC